MFCTSCGKEIDESSKFCPYCGSKNELALKQSEAPEAVSSVSQNKPVITTETFDIKENVFGLVTALVALISLLLPWVRYHGYVTSKNYNYFTFLKLLKSDDLYFITPAAALMMGAIVVLGIIIIAVCHLSNYHVVAFVGDALLLAGLCYEGYWLRVFREEFDYFGSIKLRVGFYVMLMAILLDVAMTVVVICQRKQLKNNKEQFL